MLAYLMASMMGDSENAGHLHHHYIGGLGGGGRGGRNIDGMSYDQLLQAFGDGTENLGASVESISSLPTAQVMINAKTGTVDLPPDASECNICLETFVAKDIRKTLPCLHGFHEQCIDKWLHTNGSCPTCKYRIDQS